MNETRPPLFTPPTEAAARKVFAISCFANPQRQQEDPAEPSSAEAPHPAQENLFWNEFLDERDEILTLKWIESKKVGRDIGSEETIQRWLQHRPEWRAAH